MFCSTCGKEISDAARFCEHCGQATARTAGGSTPPPASPNATFDLSGGGTVLGTPPRAPAPEGPPAETLAPGTLFHGRYHVEALVGAGGMGMVYRALDRGTGETICLKVVRPELITSRTLAERFKREGLLTRKLRHGGVVSVFDVYAGEDACYLTMEYLNGRTLRAWMGAARRARREVPLEVAAGIVRAILEGLQAAHEAQIVHRDLKPENVMLLGDPWEGDYRLKLMDFGIARVLESDVQLTLQGSAIGTRAYMAPEQETGAALVGPEADLYAVGAILYELLCDLVPTGRWDPPSAIREDLPRGVDRVVEQALKRHPRLRVASVASFLELLDGLERAPAAPGEADTGASVVPAEPQDGAARARATSLVIPEWAEAIPGDPLSSEAGQGGLARAVRHRQTGIELLLVPPGTYRRGASPGDDQAEDDEKPAHEVTITKPFYLGRYPVTQEEWGRLMGESPSKFKGRRRPVDSVSWDEIQPFLEALDLRLPTEAEWEYACRAGILGRRYGGLDEVAWYDGNSKKETHEVGGKVPNAWGFHDMLGNVWEWCANWYDEDEYGGCDGGVQDPTGPDSGEYRVLRGGSWGSGSWKCRASCRNWDDPSDRDDNYGFRVARAP